MTRFAARTYHQGVQVLLAACDEDLVGTSYREDPFTLDVTAGFYDGLRVERDQLIAMLKGCTMANLVGQATIDVALELGIIEESGIRTIEGVPHAQMIVILP